MAQRPRFDRPVAHRGLHDRSKGVIENSRSAFAAAMARGFAIECDVQLSRDGVPMIFHDDDLERLTGRQGPFGSLSAVELEATPLIGSAEGDTPQRLSAFLEQIDGRVLLQVELKRQSNAGMRERLAAETALALAGYSGPLTIESFDPHMLTTVRRHGFKGPMGIIAYDYMDHTEDIQLSSGERFVLRHLLHWPWTRFDFISCHFKALRLPAVRLLRAMGMPVTTWTIRSQQDGLVASTGADQIVFEGFDPDGE